MKHRKAVSGFLPHLLLTCGIMLLTFFCITTVNEAMCFLSSFLSQKFEIAYAAVCLLTALAAFAEKRLRFPAVVQSAAGIALAVPAVICLAQHRMDLVDTEWFRILALINAAHAILFSMLMIILQRRAARAEWKAARSAV